MSRKGKPRWGPSSFCLSAHASCPYAPHDHAPLRSFAGTPGRSASEARDRPERLLLSARGPGPARAPSAGKGRWGKGLLEAGRAGSTPTLQKVNEQANRMPRPPPKAAKTDRVLRPKGGLGNGAPTEGTPSARRGITVSVSVFQRSLSLCSFTYLRLVLIVYTALCFCRVNVCSSH